MEPTGSFEGKPCRVSHWIEQQRKWKEMKLPAQPEIPRVYVESFLLLASLLLALRKSKSACERLARSANS